MGSSSLILPASLLTCGHVSKAGHDTCDRAVLVPIPHAAACSEDYPCRKAAYSHVASHPCCRTLTCIMAQCLAKLSPHVRCGVAHSVACCAEACQSADMAPQDVNLAEHAAASAPCAAVLLPCSVCFEETSASGAGTWPCGHHTCEDCSRVCLFALASGPGQCSCTPEMPPLSAWEGTPFQNFKQTRHTSYCLIECTRSLSGRQPQIP